MKKALVLLLLLSTPAQADSWVRQCSHAGGLRTCVESYAPPYDPLAPLNGPDTMSPEQLARDQAWEVRCKPKGQVDRYGVTRLSYARPGCEFGGGE